MQMLRQDFYRLLTKVSEPDSEDVLPGYICYSYITLEVLQNTSEQ